MVELAILAGFLFVLAICGFVADYILPHIGPLNRFIDGLPMMVDETDEYEEDIPTSRKEHAA